jgi:hypothetical protein
MDRLYAKCLVGLFSGERAPCKVDLRSIGSPTTVRLPNPGLPLCVHALLCVCVCVCRESANLWALSRLNRVHCTLYSSNFSDNLGTPCRIPRSSMRRPSVDNPRGCRDCRDYRNLFYPVRSTERMSKY